MLQSTKVPKELMTKRRHFVVIPSVDHAISRLFVGKSFLAILFTVSDTSVFRQLVRTARGGRVYQHNDTSDGTSDTSVFVD